MEPIPTVYKVFIDWLDYEMPHTIFASNRFTMQIKILGLPWQTSG